MNKEQLNKSMQDIILSNAGKTSLQILNAAIELADQYATFQTESLKAEIERLKSEVKELKITKALAEDIVNSNLDTFRQR